MIVMDFAHFLSLSLHTHTLRLTPYPLQPCSVESHERTGLYWRVACVVHYWSMLDEMVGFQVFQRICCKLGLRTVFRLHNTLRQQLVQVKAHISEEDRSGIRSTMHRLSPHIHWWDGQNTTKEIDRTQSSSEKTRSKQWNSCSRMEDEP